MDEATTVVVSYPADLSGWGRLQIEEPHFRAYLTKTHEAAEPGDVWDVFLDVGCCGNTLDVPLRVEDVRGGAALTDETDVEYVEREACGIQGGWAVQSEAGP